MKIEKLIKVFEKLLPIYEEAYSKEFSEDQIRWSDLDAGLCYTSFHKVNIGISDLFTVGGYYYNLLRSKNEDGKICYLFPRPKTYKDLKPRIGFMKSEIKSLKILQKKGYTHV